MLLPQHHVLFAPPSLIQLAETRVAIAVRVGLTVLLPEQLLGKVSIQLPLPVKLSKIRHRQRGGASPWWATEQGPLQPIFVPIFPKRPPNSIAFASFPNLGD